MNDALMQTFAEVERLFYACEAGDNLKRAEAILADLVKTTNDPTVLARVYAELAQAQSWHYEYAPKGERLAIALRGMKLAKRALEYDGDGLEANAWAATLMGYHGLEMGILSALFYLSKVKQHAERALQLDEQYHSAMPHQILGDLHRLTPPAPMGFLDRKLALEHLLRARELAPACPQAKVRLAELYISLRKPALAREQLALLLEQAIDERGPAYAAKYQEKGRELLRKIG
ncbi:MAG TPA: hypothetical protein VGK74_03650 [Symbiobacteriaceae bacterium]